MSVTYAVVDQIALITLSRPDKLNALDSSSLEGLTDAVERSADDPDVRVVVLTGAGRGFCAGGDLSEDTTGRFADIDEATAWTHKHASVTGTLRGMSKPSIAAVNGACAGIGLSLAAACDLRFAAAEAVFVTAYLKAGLPGDGAIAWTLTRLVGAGRARELLLMSPRLTAERAREIGLVNGVSPAEELLEEVMSVARELAKADVETMAAMKADLVDCDELAMRAYLEVETQRHVRCGYPG